MMIFHSLELLFFFFFKPGVPKPTITWSFGGKEIKDGGRFSISSVDYEYILNIKDCSEADAGTYTVKASNTAGEATQDITVKVEVKPK